MFGIFESMIFQTSPGGILLISGSVNFIYLFLLLIVPFCWNPGFVPNPLHYTKNPWTPPWFFPSVQTLRLDRLAWGTKGTDALKLLQQLRESVEAKKCGDFWHHQKWWNTRKGVKTDMSPINLKIEAASCFLVCLFVCLFGFGWVEMGWWKGLSHCDGTDDVSPDVNHCGP